jgi:hypothetical protein
MYVWRVLLLGFFRCSSSALRVLQKVRQQLLLIPKIFSRFLEEGEKKPYFSLLGSQKMIKGKGSPRGSRGG